MKYLSLFSGVGGFELGIQRAYQGRPTSTSEMDEDMPLSAVSDGDGRRSHADCIGYSEIDKYAIQTYEKNWKGHHNYGSATDINERELPDFDLLVGGFPCQAFSIAGKRKGFDDTRGTLFFDIARILRHKRPRHLLLENVKGLLSHDSGKTIQTIAQVLSDLGYRIEWQVLNAKDFGVPQNRERIFIIGHLRGECTGQVFPISGSDRKIIEQGLVTASAVTGIKDVQISPTLDTMYKKGLGSKQPRTGVRVGTLRTHKDGQGFREVKSGIAPTIPARARQDGSGQPVIRQPLRFLDRNQKNIDGDYAFTVDASQTSGVRQDTRIRRLTPTECERLMSWPDGWTEGVSDTQRYKQCGNGVVSNCVQAVIEKMLETCL